MPDLSVILAAAIAAATGVLSGWGIGGGTLLILILILFFKADAGASQFINLAYFIPSAAASLFFHAKSGYVEKKAVLLAGTCGCVSAALSYYLGQYISGRFLSILFGIVLLYLGIREVLSKS
jgi:uncharacterized membrane protein YfcA